nr:hypothetical protein [Tanacetum cinerariifolium]
GDRMTLQETVWTVEEEAYAARVAWNHFIGLIQETYQELQTHCDHVYVHETHIQTHQTHLQLQSTLIQTHHQVSETGFQIQQTAMAKLRETDRERQVQLTETLRVVRDIRQEMSDMHKELISQREQQIMVRTRRGHTPPPTNPNNITPEAVQTMIDQALLRNFSGEDGSHSSHAENPRNMHTARLCYYTDFMKCHPLNFKGTEGEVGLTRWIEKMESIFNISGVLKKKMTDKYCLLGEVKKLEIELWNLKVRDNNIPAYTNRFQELALICTKFVSNETEKVDKYISGIPDNIYGNVKSSKPKTLDKTIELANELMDQKLRTYAKRKSNSKRKADDISRNNQQPFKRGNRNAQRWVYDVGNVERNGNAMENPDSNVVT